MIAAQLLQTEWIKTRHRIAFSASLLFFFGFLSIAAGTLYLLQRQGAGAGLGLPNGWSSMVDAASGLGGLVLTVLVVLLTASEKTWRTERQNIIDGLSRTQYFTGKVILLLCLAVIMVTGVVLITAVFGLLDRGLQTAAPFIDAVGLKMLGGLLLRFLVVAAIAFFFSMITTGSGAALAIAFLFTMIQPILMAIIMMRGPESLRPLVPYLPTEVLDVLTSRATYVAGSFDALAQMQSPFRVEPLSAQAAVLVAITYAILFAGGAWLSIRKRDL